MKQKKQPVKTANEIADSIEAYAKSLIEMAQNLRGTADGKGS